MLTQLVGNNTPRPRFNFLGHSETVRSPLDGSCFHSEFLYNLVGHYVFLKRILPVTRLSKISCHLDSNRYPPDPKTYLIPKKLIDIVHYPATSQCRSDTLELWCVENSQKEHIHNRTKFASHFYRIYQPQFSLNLTTLFTPCSSLFNQLSICC